MNEGPKKIDRRKFLRHSASVIALGAASLALPAAKAEEPTPVDDPMRVPGVLPRPYGARSPFEKQTRLGGAGPGGVAWLGRQCPKQLQLAHSASGFAWDRHAVRSTLRAAP